MQEGPKHSQNLGAGNGGCAPPQPTTVILNNIYSHFEFEVAFYVRALLALCKNCNVGLRQASVREF